MPYMIRYLEDCPVYICKTAEESAEALDKVVKLARLTPTEALIVAIVFGAHYANPKAVRHELFGISVEHLTEEECDLWQKAF